jgi:hypothetical protein
MAIIRAPCQDASFGARAGKESISGGGICRINRSLIFALDAADANLLEEWEQEGYLPALSSIMREGRWGKIGGNEYCSPHGLWLSLFSGLSKAEHGHYYFHQLKPGSYSLYSHDVNELVALPFWSNAGLTGARVAVLDVPETCVVANLDGCQLVNFRIHNSMGVPVASPRSFLTTAVQLSGKRQIVPERLNSTIDQDRKSYNQLLQRITGIGALSVEILKREKPDCTVIGLLRINLKGREPFGIVDAGADYEGLLD